MLPLHIISLNKASKLSLSPIISSRIPHSKTHTPFLSSSFFLEKKKRENRYYLRWCWRVNRGCRGNESATWGPKHLVPVDIYGSYVPRNHACHSNLWPPFWYYLLDYEVCYSTSKLIDNKKNTFKFLYDFRHHTTRTCF